MTTRRARPIYHDLQEAWISPHRSTIDMENCGWPGSLSHACVTNARTLCAVQRAERAVDLTKHGRRYYVSRMVQKPRGYGHDTRYVRLPKNYCFACGKNNPEGMRLKFAYDEERECFVCRFRLGKRFTGPPGHCHGGIIATILDEAMGKVNKLRHVVALTSEI